MLSELLGQSAALFPDRPAVVEGKRSLTYRGLLHAVEGMCRHLRHAGLGASDALAVQIPNSVECAIALLAAASESPTLLLDPSLKAPEVGRQCRRAGARALLCREAGGTGPAEAEVRSCVAPPLDALCEAGRRSSRPAEGSERFDPGGRPLFMLLSSGTTGPPKIVPKTAAQARAALQSYTATLPYHPEDRVLGVLPFFHSFGLFNVLLAALARGATLNVTSFSPRGTAKLIERDGITVLPATPFMFRMLAETDFRTVPDFSSVRLAVSAGSALSSGVARRFQEKVGVAIAQSYGTTEAGPISLALSGQQMDQPGWVGRPYAGVTVETWDESGDPVGPGSEGEIAVKTGAGASCYLNSPEASAVTFRKGYVLTGDIGCRNEAGDLFVLGRERPMLNVAGKKVSPSEVEACLRSHPAVGDVLVVGTKTGDGDERVKALVVRAGEVTALELQDFCGKRLADFKVPRAIMFVENLSEGAMGKTPINPAGRAEE